MKNKNEKQKSSLLQKIRVCLTPKDTFHRQLEIEANDYLNGRFDENADRWVNFQNTLSDKGIILRKDGGHLDVLTVGVDYPEFCDGDIRAPDVWRCGTFIVRTVMKSMKDYAGNDFAKQDEFAKAFRNEGIILRANTRVGDKT